MHQDTPEFRSFCEPWQRMIRRKDMERRQAVPYSPASQCVSDCFSTQAEWLWCGKSMAAYGGCMSNDTLSISSRTSSRAFQCFENVQNYDVYIYIYMYIHIIYYIYTPFSGFFEWICLCLARRTACPKQRVDDRQWGSRPRWFLLHRSMAWQWPAQAKWVSLMTAYLRGIKEGMVKNCLGIGILHTWVRGRRSICFQSRSIIQNSQYLVHSIVLFLWSNHGPVWTSKRLKKIKLFSGLKI